MRRLSWRSAPLLLVSSVLLAACTGTGSGGPIEHPAGDRLVLRVATQGGFIGPGVLFTSFPGFSLLGDGRVIVPGAQIELYPGPALPAVNVRRLTEAGIQAILDEVLKTGVFSASAEYRGAQNVVADAPDTVFTLEANGRQVTVLVYGLGTLPEGNTHTGISAEELATHAALLHLSERLMNLDAWLPANAWADPDWTPFQPDALRLLVRNADADPPDGSGIGNQLVNWLTSDDPAAFGTPAGALPDARCGVVSGPDVAVWYRALSAANQLTRFTHAGHRYEVSVRFMLSDEELTCPDVIR
jgi:hypothetical protein